MGFSKFTNPVFVECGIGCDDISASIPAFTSCYFQAIAETGSCFF